jgi:hypothetical protein
MELKHVGRIIATGKRCVVAYRTLPGDAYNCVIVPDSYHDAVINLVESNAGQSAYEFAEAMARSTLPDGSTMLAALHTQGRLIKIATDKVEMTPTPGVTVVLSELNQIIAEQRGIPVDGLSIKSSDSSGARPDAPAQKTTTPAATPVAETAEIKPVMGDTPEEQAKFYRSQADKLAKEAAAMRRKAEELAPTKKTKEE